MRLFISTVLIALLVINQAEAQQPTSDAIRAQVATILPASLVEIRMRSGQTLRGHIPSHTDTNFTLNHGRGGKLQTLGYDQVSSVSTVTHSYPHKGWIIGGLIVGALAVAVIVIAIIVKPVSLPPG